MATVIDRRSHKNSGVMLAVAVMFGLIALVAVNFVYNNQGLSVAPSVQTAPSTPAPTSTP